MTNVTQPLVAPAAEGNPRSTHWPTDWCRRSLVRDPQQRACGQGLSRYRDRRTDHLGAHRLADVDDVRTCLLCDRDDADVDAALRFRAFRLRPARVTSTDRRDERGGDALQQDGACFTQGL